MPERVELRLEMLRGGRRIDLNLTRSHRVRIGVGRGDSDEVTPPPSDQQPPRKHRRGGGRVFVGERGRLTAWTLPADNEVRELDSTLFSK